MRLKASLAQNILQIHEGLASSIAWYSSDEFVSCGDDRKLYFCNITTGTINLFYQLPFGLFPICMHWSPNHASNLNKQYSDILALGTANGILLLIKRGGRLEKNIDAHNGVICCLKWNSDGSSLSTSGEDGVIKIWSRLGMLRSTLVHSESPVYSFAWSPCNEQIVFPKAGFIVIRSLHQALQPMQWKAHDALIMAIDWGRSNSSILSGSEDGHIKVWDSYGKLVFAIYVHDSPISSLSWTPNNESFAVGSFNQIKFIHRFGWTLYLQRYSDVGYVNTIDFSPDAVNVLVVYGSGSVFGYTIIDMECNWMQYEVITLQECSLLFRDYLNNIEESIEYPERILNIKIGWNHLIILTRNKCFIQNISTLNSMDMLELNGYIQVVASYLTDSYFVIFDQLTALQMYSYDGKLIVNNSLTGTRSKVLHSQQFALSSDFVAIRDIQDDKLIHVTNLFTGQSITGVNKDFSHTVGISILNFCNIQTFATRPLAFLDKNNDLYILLFSLYYTNTLLPFKLGNFVSSFHWHDKCPMLAAIQEGLLTIWFNPFLFTVDKDLFRYTKILITNIDIGPESQISEFSGHNCILKNTDGSISSIYISSHLTTLHFYLDKKRWEDCIRFCRVVSNTKLWACLASSAASEGEIQVSEIAYSALHAIDKVEFWKKIGAFIGCDIKSAVLSLLQQKNTQAEATFLKCGEIFKAIEMNIKTFNWDRALSLAIKHQTHIDTCIAYRTKFIKSLSIEEDRKKFQQFSDIEIDWRKIHFKLLNEYEKVLSLS